MILFAADLHHSPKSLWFLNPPSPLPFSQNLKGRLAVLCFAFWYYCVGRTRLARFVALLNLCKCKIAMNKFSLLFEKNLFTQWLYVPRWTVGYFQKYVHQTRLFICKVDLPIRFYLFMVCLISNDFFWSSDNIAIVHIDHSVLNCTKIFGLHRYFNWVLSTMRIEK